MPIFQITYCPSDCSFPPPHFSSPRKTDSDSKEFFSELMPFPTPTLDFVGAKLNQQAVSDRSWWSWNLTAGAGRETVPTGKRDWRVDRSGFLKIYTFGRGVNFWWRPWGGWGDSRGFWNYCIIFPFYLDLLFEVFLLSRSSEQFMWDFLFCKSVCRRWSAQPCSGFALPGLDFFGIIWDLVQFYAYICSLNLRT